MKQEGQYDRFLRQADRIHRFPAKMFPCLAYSFLKSIVDGRATQRIRFHDPMCGSGSTALVARSLGVTVSASDILYPAIIITKAKLTRLPDVSLEEMISFSSRIKTSEKSRPDHPWANWRIWFTPRVLRCLEEVADQVYETRRKSFFPHLTTALFQTIWDVSAADKHVLVPTRSRYSRIPPNMSPRKVLGIFHHRLSRILSAQGALGALGVSFKQPEINQSNSLTEQGWTGEEKDVILTSPPYGCGIDYERVFRLQMRLWSRFLGDDAIYSKAQLVGRSSHILSGNEGLPDSEIDSEWYKTVSRASPSRLRMFIQYVSDLRIFLQLCARHLSNRGTLGLVIGNPEIAKQKIPLTRIICKLAEEQELFMKTSPHCDLIRSRTQNLRLRSATGPIKEEFLLSFNLR